MGKAILKGIYCALPLILIGIGLIGTARWKALGNKAATTTNKVTTQVLGSVASTALAPAPHDPTEALPDTAKVVLANFYAGFKARDRERLESLFTPDTTSEQKSQRTNLFISDAGNNDQPDLFSTPATSQVVVSYTVVAATPEAGGWLVTIRENRENASNEPIGTALVLVTLQPAPVETGTWLLDSYSRTGDSGKYNGFLLQ